MKCLTSNNVHGCFVFQSSVLYHEFCIPRDYLQALLAIIKLCMIMNTSRVAVYYALLLLLLLLLLVGYSKCGSETGQEDKE